jgi:hypothetical protein
MNRLVDIAPVTVAQNDARLIRGRAASQRHSGELSKCNALKLDVALFAGHFLFQDHLCRATRQDASIDLVLLLRMVPLLLLFVFFEFIIIVTAGNGHVVENGSDRFIFGNVQHLSWTQTKHILPLVFFGCRIMVPQGEQSLSFRLHVLIQGLNGCITFYGRVGVGTSHGPRKDWFIIRNRSRRSCRAGIQPIYQLLEKKWHTIADALLDPSKKRRHGRNRCRCKSSSSMCSSSSTRYSMHQ